jgi:hypothetical protein
VEVDETATVESASEAWILTFNGVDLRKRSEWRSRQRDLKRANAII